MTWNNFLESFIANIDTQMPWLLPSLEALEQAVPAAIRLLVCVPLVTWLVYSRQHQATHVAIRFERPGR